MEESSGLSSMKFFSDQHLSYADILLPHEARARIEVSVLNLLRILNSPDPAISDLSLCGKLWKYAFRFCFKRNESHKESSSITDVVALLRCSRYSLGIMASSRGLVAGRLFLQEPGKEAVDCSACGSSGFAITGDLNLLDNTIMRTDARYIIIVEKHAIFHRLVEDRVFNHIPCVFITAKGYPDIATRNPAGLAILCTFKFGSIGMGLEAYRYACNVKWIGLRGDDLNLIPEESLVPLKPKDSQIAKSLLSSKILQENYIEELSLMVQTGKRAEIEALYCHGYNYLGKYIATKIVQGKYI
ncbi:F22C12.24 [Arabidopsis thaliana]|nr:F22C12.24 [Arabidopsis thaliana]